MPVLDTTRLAIQTDLYSWKCSNVHDICFGSLWHMHMRSKQKCFLQIINIVIYIGAFGAQQPA